MAQIYSKPQYFVGKLPKLYIIDYSVEFSGLGLPKNGDESLGFCTQVAVFMRNSDEGPLKEAVKFEKNEKVICCWDYPYMDPCKINLKSRVVEEIKYGYK